MSSHYSVCMYSYTVDLFLDLINQCLAKDAVLLTLTPQTIGGKDVTDQFVEYIPRKSRLVMAQVGVHFL